METVKLGDHVIPVPPQRHARLRNQLNDADFRKVLSRDYGAESYRLLCILIPSLKQVPEYEWEGYASQEAMESGHYDEDADRSPTGAEIVDAFETALSVNGAGKLGKLLGLITDMTKMGQQAQAAKAEAESESSMPGSPESPGENGGSTSTSTGVKSPT